jgi:hypothetical protein
MSAESRMPARAQIDGGQGDQRDVRRIEDAGAAPIDDRQAGAGMSAVSTMPAPRRSTTDKAGLRCPTVSTMPAARTSMKKRRPRCPPYQRCRRRAQIDRHRSD